MSELDMSLPPMIYTKHPTNSSIIAIKRGVIGYYPVEVGDQTLDELNSSFRATKAQITAMEFGSVFGWHIPAAFASYHEDRN